MFIFSCYTVFAYIDVVNLTKSDVKIGADGKQWLIKNRQKTYIAGKSTHITPAQQAGIAVFLLQLQLAK
ncbi:MAG TPA: hypothetical protein VK616_10680 [Flavitalea sp.]|nr:hypothetical protein [Flavitalea sp.]